MTAKYGYGYIATNLVSLAPKHPSTQLCKPKIV